MKKEIVGQKIAKARQAKGLTQAELSELSSVSIRTIQRLELGQVIPRMYTIKTLSKYLDVDLLAEFKDLEELTDNNFFYDLLTKWICEIKSLFNLKTYTMKKIIILSAAFSLITIGLYAFTKEPKNQKDDGIQLNKNYQFVSMVNTKIFCRGTLVFDKIDENGLWHGIQKNATQQSEVLVTAKLVNDSLEIHTAEPWEEIWKVNSINNGIYTGTVSADYSLAQNSVITFEIREEGISLDKTYQFTSYLNEELFCRGTFHFYDKDKDGIWHGIQKNETQQSEILVTAKKLNDSLEIYTSGLWNEIWKVTSIENGISSGSISANYSLAQDNKITFELSEIVNKK